MTAPDDAARSLAEAHRLGALGRFEEALALLDALHARAPTAAVAFARALALLRLGRLQEGFALYEARLEEPPFARQRALAPERRWRGGHRPGDTILLVAEQGMGDTIQFARYAPLAAARGLKVILHTAPVLYRLLETLGPFALALTSQPLPQFDWQIPLVSLPGALGTTPETIPAQVPYLAADPHAVASMARRIALLPRPRIGLVWAAAETDPLLHHRSLPIDVVEDFVRRTRAGFASLQVGPRAAEFARLAPHGAIDLAPFLYEYGETAAAIAALDLVVSVDTSVAHLAGALARPVWTLLSLPSDWRWFVGRADSPWYPTMRLFRQSAPGDWAPVLHEVEQALAAA